MTSVLDKVLWLVPARSGSKSIPNKNIKMLGPLPLLAYRILTATRLSAKENIWISTDSSGYAELAEKYGAFVPFLRPSDLASDSASSMDVVLHAMDFAENNGFNDYEYIGLLEPTSPFIYSSTLNDAVHNLVNDINAEAIVAVKESLPNIFFIQDDDIYLAELAQRFKDAKSLRRQAYKKQITPSGGFYISRWEAFKKNKSFYTEKTIAFEVPVESTVEIDEPIDWVWAEFLLEHGVFTEELI
jgi:CMP-N,N'-diacetyllegionaminic acid synthase